jgi:hypothetical protein
MIRLVVCEWRPEYCIYSTHQMILWCPLPENCDLWWQSLWGVRQWAGNREIALVLLSPLYPARTQNQLCRTLTTAIRKSTSIWDMILCSLIEIYWCYGSFYVVVLLFNTEYEGYVLPRYREIFTKLDGVTSEELILKIGPLLWKWIKFHFYSLTKRFNRFNFGATDHEILWNSIFLRRKKSQPARGDPQQVLSVESIVASYRNRSECYTSLELKRQNLTQMFKRHALSKEIKWTSSVKPTATL